MPQNKIILPSDFDPELEDLVTGFLKEATPGVSRNTELQDRYFLEKQFLYGQTWNSSKALLIYSIKNTKVPLVRFDNNEIEYTVFAFFTRLDKDKLHLH